MAEPDAVVISEATYRLGEQLLSLAQSQTDPVPLILAHYQLGMVNVNKGANEEAIAEFEKYLELEPEGANAATATSIINHLKSL